MVKNDSARAGDLVQVVGHRVGDAARSGRIVEVISGQARPHLRVLWEDDHVSLLYPGPDIVVTRPASRPHESHEATRALAREHVSFELIPHWRTKTAREEAAAVGVAPGDVAKTLVLFTDEGFVRVVVPASERLDIGRARTLLGGGKRTRLVTEAELAGAYPMFELGAVAPFGGPEGDRVVIDRRLLQHDSVVLDAGSHTESVRMTTSDLRLLTRAEVADLCED